VGDRLYVYGLVIWRGSIWWGRLVRLRWRDGRAVLRLVGVGLRSVRPRWERVLARHVRHSGVCPPCSVAKVPHVKGIDGVNGVRRAVHHV
jgi:hypothetical protein